MRRLFVTQRSGGRRARARRQALAVVGSVSDRHRLAVGASTLQFRHQPYSTCDSFYLGMRLQASGLNLNLHVADRVTIGAGNGILWQGATYGWYVNW